MAGIKVLHNLKSWLPSAREDNARHLCWHFYQDQLETFIAWNQSFLHLHPSPKSNLDLLLSLQCCRAAQGITVQGESVLEQEVGCTQCTLNDTFPHMAALLEIRFGIVTFFILVWRRMKSLMIDEDKPLVPTGASILQKVKLFRYLAHI